EATARRPFFDTAANSGTCAKCRRTSCGMPRAIGLQDGEQLVEPGQLRRMQPHPVDLQLSLEQLAVHRAPLLRHGVGKAEPERDGRESDEVVRLRLDP